MVKCLLCLVNIIDIRVYDFIVGLILVYVYIILQDMSLSSKFNDRFFWKEKIVKNVLIMNRYDK